MSDSTENPHLVTLLFHSLFEDVQELAGSLAHPQERTTVESFRYCVECLLSDGYRFLSPSDLLKGEFVGDKQAMLTFDDGYYNNVRALPVLEEFDVPAVFYISTYYTQKQRSYWWEVAIHEEMSKGRSFEEAMQANRAIGLHKTCAERERYIVENYGENVLVPTRDVNRPMTPDELIEFASHRLVHIGNHTSHHDYLPSLPVDDVAKSIDAAQRFLTDLLGVSPVSFSYPHGGHTDEIRTVVGERFAMAHDVEFSTSQLPLAEDEKHMIKRYVLDGRRVRTLKEASGSMCTPEQLLETTA